MSETSNKRPADTGPRPPANEPTSPRHTGVADMPGVGHIEQGPSHKKQRVGGDDEGPIGEHDGEQEYVSNAQAQPQPPEGEKPKRKFKKVVQSEALRTRGRIFPEVLDIDPIRAHQMVVADRSSLSHLCDVYRVTNDPKARDEFKLDLARTLPIHLRREFLDAIESSGKRRSVRGALMLAPEEAPKLVTYIENAINPQLKGICSKAHSQAPVDPTGEMLALTSARQVIQELHDQFLNETDEQWNLQTRGLAVSLMDLAFNAIRFHIKHRRMLAQSIMLKKNMMGDLE